LAKVLVLDGHSPAALAFTRSLGRAGHWVSVGSNRGIFAAATLSRYCRAKVEYPASTESVHAFIEAVLAFATQHKIEAIFPVTDWTTLPLSAHRDQFPEACRLALPLHNALKLAGDKYRTIELAQSLAIPTPRTWLIQSARDLSALPQLSFPIVVKDRFSVRWLGDRAAFGSVSYAYSTTDLELRVTQRLQDAGDVLVQEFVPGVGMGFSAFACEGQIRLPFQWKRLREVDPRGSASSLREAVALDPDISEFSRKLILSSGFQGIAMVEFKNVASGKPVLMEINGRPWGSIQLPIAAGIDYPRFLADWILDHRLPPSEIKYREGIECRRMVGDLGHLENLRRGTPPEWPVPYPNFWLSLIKMAVPWYPGLRYDDVSLDDPKPGWAGISHWLRIRLRKKSGTASH
jgi:predicted ATP-grasp superfamily ATP-dependent carboligase